MNIAKVIVDVPASTINQTFDYQIPTHLQSIVQPGMRVIIPFGPRKITGFVIKRTSESSFGKLKEIIDVLDLTPVLTKELLILGKWLADELLSLYIATYHAMLPQVLKAKYEKEIVKLTDDILPPELETLFQQRSRIKFDEIDQSRKQMSLLKKHLESMDLEIQYIVKNQAKKKYKTYVIPPSLEELQEAKKALSSHAHKQAAIIDFFIEHDGPVEERLLLKELKTTKGTLKTLYEKFSFSPEQVEVYRDPYERKFVKTEKLSLTNEQKMAMQPIQEALQKDESETFLLHGVTGSGKTEIYLQAIEQVIQQGKEAIVLVPEISLTPMMVERFKGRFGSEVAVLHSALSIGEKYDEWRKVLRKEVSVVVGARSAIFAPFENLGIIIIDEEHETTYKQEESPRYHARDVAIKRAQYNHCPVILGSATPTLESFARAKKGVYQLLTLSKRTNDKALPEVSVVDMREELHGGNRSMFSIQLIDDIKDCMERGEQIVLLLNRRGYSTFALCRDCGHVEECPNCDISLTYHKRNQMLKCHYCSHEQPIPKVCPKCDSNLIRFFGTGTERVEESLTSLIPEARIIRMDVDTTSRKGAHEKLLSQFQNQEADILLGTQMIAKGLDFENVTLVGVLAADSMLHLPDFRSSEKTFQLLTQVSGRAGRHELPGNVIIQTYTPEHYSIQLASKYDFTSFYQHEMSMRHTFLYPPYVFLVLLTISDENEQTVIRTAQQIHQGLMKQLEQGTMILGPVPSPITRVKNRYRYQLILKYRYHPHLQRIIANEIDQFQKEMRQGLQIIVDFNPYQLM